MQKEKAMSFNQQTNKLTTEQFFASQFSIIISAFQEWLRCQQKLTQGSEMNKRSIWKHHLLILPPTEHGLQLCREPASSSLVQNQLEWPCLTDVLLSAFNIMDTSTVNEKTINRYRPAEMKASATFCQYCLCRVFKHCFITSGNFGNHPDKCRLMHVLNWQVERSELPSLPISCSPLMVNVPYSVEKKKYMNPSFLHQNLGVEDRGKNNPKRNTQKKSQANKQTNKKPHPILDSQT